MLDLLIRFLAGGVIVCVFAAVGDMLKPKSFAGLFGAAPSVALATLTLTIIKQGAPYAAAESRSMIMGGVAFLMYGVSLTYGMRYYRLRCLTVAILCMPLWFAVAFVSWAVWANW